MLELYVPRTGTITVFGQTHLLHKGIHPVPDIIAHSHEANTYGIKPVEEMVDEEWRLIGMNKDAYFAARKAAEEKPEAVAPLDASATKSPPADK